MHPLFPKASRLSKTIIGAALEVHRDMGPGLTRSIYEWCLRCELELRSVASVDQRVVHIGYKGFSREEALTFDLLVEDCVLVDLRVDGVESPGGEAKLLSQMKLLDVPMGVRIDFNVAQLSDGIARVILHGADVQDLRELV